MNKPENITHILQAGGCDSLGLKVLKAQSVFLPHRLLGVGNEKTRLNVNQSWRKTLLSYLYMLCDMCAVMRSEGEETSVFYKLLPLLCHILQLQLNLQPYTDQSFISIYLSHPLLTCSVDFSVWLYPLSRHTTVTRACFNLMACPRALLTPH